jgi:hypothetical protein
MSNPMRASVLCDVRRLEVRDGPKARNLGLRSFGEDDGETVKGVVVLPVADRQLPILAGPTTASIDNRQSKIDNQQ